MDVECVYSSVVNDKALYIYTNNDMYIILISLTIRYIPLNPHYIIISFYNKSCFSWFVDWTPQTQGGWCSFKWVFAKRNGGRLKNPSVGHDVPYLKWWKIVELSINCEYTIVYPNSKQSHVYPQRIPWRTCKDGARMEGALRRWRDLLIQIYWIKNSTRKYNINIYIYMVPCPVFPPPHGMGGGMIPLCMYVCNVM